MKENKEHNKPTQQKENIKKILKSKRIKSMVIAKVIN